MTVTWIVALGLIIDAFGALWIAGPDLPSRYRRRIINVTPKVRKIYKSTEVLKDGMDASQTDISRVSETLWPKLKEKWGFQSTKFNEVLNPRLEERGSIQQVVQLTMNVEDFEIHEPIDSVDRMVNNYIDRKIRVWGWLALASGFLIQLIGTMVPLLL